MSKHWTTDEINLLKDGLYNGKSHEEIGSLIGRTKSSVMHKVQRLGLSRKFKTWTHLTVEDYIALVNKYKTASEFDSNPDLPPYKTVLRWLNLSSWEECLEFCGVDPNIRGKYEWSYPTIFYILQFKDIDNTIFYKYGITQRNIKIRYQNRSDYTIITEVLCKDLREAINKEAEMKKTTISYTPKDRRFYSQGHGGYTECYIEHDS